MDLKRSIYKKIYNFLSNKNKNKKIKALVTAGPTNEYIDPVRYITNKSSGKQGYEIAKSLFNRGFDTTLISGPTNIEISEHIKLIQVETAEEMFKATQQNLPTDVAIFAAAVSDFKVKKKHKKKIPKQENLVIDLEKNIDILNYVSNHNSKRPKLVIGFAAETHNLEKNAINKLQNKNCDWIIANDISKKEGGFESELNEVIIYYKNLNKKKEKLSLKNKSEIYNLDIELALRDCTIIEWPEIIEDILPNDRINIYFVEIDNTKIEILVRSNKKVKL